MGEAPVARGTHGAVSTNHVGPTAALATKRLAGVTLCSDLMATARQRAIIEERRQRRGGGETEGRGRGRTVGHKDLVLKVEAAERAELLVLPPT